MNNNKEMTSGDTTTLLPYRGDLDEKVFDQETLKRMNIILKLNNEQILGLLSSYSSNEMKLRAVVKDGKVIGLRVVKNTAVADNNGSKKVEVIKCNVVRESNGNIYSKIRKPSIADKSTNNSYAANLGPLDYRLNLINYKPSIDNQKIEDITKLGKLVKIVESIISTIDESSKSNSFGFYYDSGQVILKLIKEGMFNSDAKDEIKKLLNELRPKRSRSEEDMIEWKWLKYTRSFDNTRWVKRLFQEGYRRDDSYTMLYSGKVDQDMVRQKSYNNLEKIEYNNISDSVSPPISSKSSIVSHSTFSRPNSVSSGSRNTTPSDNEQEVIKAKLIKEEVKEGNVVKEVKKVKRSFKEYQIAKMNGLSSAGSSVPSSPSLKSTSKDIVTGDKNSHAKDLPDQTSREIPVSTSSQTEILRKRKVPTDGVDSVETEQQTKRANILPALNLPKGPKKSPKLDESKLQETENQKRIRIPKGTKGNGVNQVKNIQAKDNVLKTDADATDLVSKYQSKYLLYYELYKEIRNMNVNDDLDSEETNKKIKELIKMQNELESTKFRLRVYSDNMNEGISK